MTTHVQTTLDRIISLTQRQNLLKTVMPTGEVIQYRADPLVLPSMPEPIVFRKVSKTVFSDGSEKHY